MAKRTVPPAVDVAKTGPVVATKAPVLRLLPPAVDQETIKALSQLLVGAQDGEVVGIAFVAAVKGRVYVTDVTGSLYREPTLARGMLAALDDMLEILVYEHENLVHVPR
jgi:hypothetical protein